MSYASIDIEARAALHFEKTNSREGNITTSFFLGMTDL
jgi:hypothetical protein